MKKILLLSLCACTITQTHGALSRLQKAATALSATLKKSVPRSFTTNTPLKKTVSDTIWQTKEGQVVRVMGDVHMPSDKPYFELLESSFKEIDKTGHKTTVLVEGCFDESSDAWRTKEEIEKSKSLAMTKLNTLAKTASFKTLELGLTKVRALPQFTNFTQYLPAIISFTDLIDNEQWRSLMTAPLVARFKSHFLNQNFFQNFNAHAIEKLNKHLKSFITELETSIAQENNNAITTLFTASSKQTTEFLCALNNLKKIDMTKVERLIQKHFETLDTPTFIAIGTEIKKALLPEKAEAKKCANLASTPLSLYVVLEDAELLMHILTATKANKNVITYSGALHSMNINTTLQALRFNQIKHDGPTVIDASKVTSYGLDEKTIESNNALFLGLLQQPTVSFPTKR